MSMIVLASAKGAPGVTTAAIALGAVWPRRTLVVEADPAGGDLAARFQLPSEPNLLSLGAAARRGELGAEDVWAHVQQLPRGLEVLVGVRAAEQARALGRLWSLLPDALGELDADTLVDCGRLTPGTVAEDLLRRADLPLLVCRPTIEGVLHLGYRLEGLGRVGVAAEVILVGERPFDRARVQDALAANGMPAPVRGVLADDDRAAGMLAGQAGRERWLERVSPLIRSARGLADDLAESLPAPAGQEVGA
jgi:hypothetical protein